MFFENISPQEFHELSQKPDHVILDVRTPEELSEGQVEGHLMIDVSSNEFYDKVTDLDKSKTYLVYCRSGKRSQNACMVMHNLGFEKLYNLNGGIKAWNQVFGK